MKREIERIDVIKVSSPGFDLKRGKEKVVGFNTTIKIVEKLNEVIDRLNKELDEDELPDWKDGDILNTVDKEGWIHHFVLKEISD